VVLELLELEELLLFDVDSELEELELDRLVLVDSLELDELLLFDVDSLELDELLLFDVDSELLELELDELDELLLELEELVPTVTAVAIPNQDWLLPIVVTVPVTGSTVHNVPTSDPSCFTP
jgi:hypothetical protein